MLFERVVLMMMTWRRKRAKSDLIIDAELQQFRVFRISANLASLALVTKQSTEKFRHGGFANW